MATPCVVVLYPFVSGVFPGLLLLVKSVDSVRSISKSLLGKGFRVVHVWWLGPPDLGRGRSLLPRAPFHLPRGRIPTRFALSPVACDTCPQRNQEVGGVTLTSSSPGPETGRRRTKGKGLRTRRRSSLSRGPDGDGGPPTSVSRPHPNEMRRPSQVPRKIVHGSRSKSLPHPPCPCPLFPMKNAHTTEARTSATARGPQNLGRGYLLLPRRLGPF